MLLPRRGHQEAGTEHGYATGPQWVGLTLTSKRETSKRCRCQSAGVARAALCVACDASRVHAVDCVKDMENDMGTECG